MFNKSGHQTQVRAISGGGSRNIRVPITAKKADVIAEAKKLFFPSGESPLGHDSEFSFDLLDARCRVVPDDQTVGEMYATLKLAGYLRFNMTTRRHEPDSQASMVSFVVDLQWISLRHYYYYYTCYFYPLTVHWSLFSIISAY